MPAPSDSGDEGLIGGSKMRRGVARKPRSSAQFRSLPVERCELALERIVAVFSIESLEAIAKECSDLLIIDRVLQEQKLKLETKSSRHFTSRDSDTGNLLEVGGICKSLTELERGLFGLTRRLAAYDSSQRSYFTMLLGESAFMFEPQSKLATLAKTNESAFSKWVKGRSVPQEAGRELAIRRIHELVEATLKTVQDYNVLVTMLLDREGHVRSKLERSYTNVVCESSKSSGKVVDFATHKELL